MRVDGVPNVMTCQRRPKGGERVESQNTVGGAEHDLLAVTDFFFPKGLDHHHLMTSFGPANRLMQRIAREIAGIGTLPESKAEAQSIGSVHCDIAVIGGGPAGRAAANAALADGHKVVLVSRNQTPREEARLPLSPPVHAIDGEALAFFPEEDVLLVQRSHGDGLLLLRSVARIFATGACHSPHAFPGSDRPGVISPNALAALFSHGWPQTQKVPKRIAFVGEQVPLWAHALLARHDFEVRGPFLPNDCEVSGAAPSLKLQHKGTAMACAAVVNAGPPSARYELAGQSGAKVSLRGGGFFAEDQNGRLAPMTFGAGALLGPLDRAEAEASGSQAAATCLRRLGEPR